MDKVYLGVQVITSFYVIQRLFEKEMPYGMAVLIIGGHLVIYLVGCILKKEHYKEWAKWIDMLYIGIGLLNGIEGMILLFGAMSMELWYANNGYMKKVVVMGGSILVSLFNLKQLQYDWFSLSILLIAGYVIGENCELIKNLKKGQLELLEKVGNMKKKVEYANLSKNEIAYMTQINERNQIAQKLHDELGHVLAGSIMQLEATKIILPQDEGKGMLMLEQITENLRQGMERIRSSVKELKPDTGEKGLAGIKELLLKLQEEAQVKTHISFEGDLEAISLERWQVIKANIQEAITNFIKYSTGDRFAVRIEVLNKIIKVQISDNGSVETDIKKSLGLIGIEERTIECGGRLVVNTEEGFELIMILGR